MAWTLKQKPFSPTGTVGRNAVDNFECIAQGDPAADNSTSVAGMLTFIYSAVGDGGVPVVSPTNWLNTLDHFDYGLIVPKQGIWKINFVYRDQNQTRQTGDGAFSFSVAGGSQHITCSTLANGGAGTTAYPPGKGPTNLGPIGDKGDGSGPDGIDIDSQTFFKFKTTYFVSTSSIQAVINAILALRGPVNSQTVTFNIRGVTISCPKGSLRLEGVEGQERVGFGDWEVVFHFIYKPNLTGITVGQGANAVSGVNVNGWDYLEAPLQPTPDPTAKCTVWVIKNYVLVHQVYVYDDLNSVLPPGTVTLTGAAPWASTPPAGLFSSSTFPNPVLK